MRFQRPFSNPLLFVNQVRLCGWFSVVVWVGVCIYSVEVNKNLPSLPLSPLPSLFLPKGEKPLILENYLSKFGSILCFTRSVETGWGLFL